MTALLLGVALLFLGPVVQRILLTRNALRERRMRAALAIGTVLLVLAIAAPSIDVIFSPALAASVSDAAADFHVWMALYFLAFAYYAYTEFALRRERDAANAAHEATVDAFRLAIEKWVLPRRVTKSQTKTIEELLKRFEPHTVQIARRTGDEEAGSFADDLVRAFSNGGWHVDRAEAADLRPGLTVTYPSRGGQVPEAHHPNPEQLVLQALETADVPLDGGTGSSSAAAPVVIIAVGPRRRDLRAAAQRWYEIDDYF